METAAKPVIDITGVKEPAYFLAEERSLDALEEEVAWLMEDEGWLPTGGPFSAYHPKWKETFWHQALYRPAGDANTRRVAETSRPELFTGATS